MAGGGDPAVFAGGVVLSQLSADLGQALFHLQRHSDHHAHPLRRYQSLRHFDDVPQLPIGYFGMFPLAYVPPLWRRVMDPRLLAQVGHDAAHINIDPRQRAAIVRKYGLRDLG